MNIIETAAGGGKSPPAEPHENLGISRTSAASAAAWATWHVAAMGYGGRPRPFHSARHMKSE
jgi:hypothetical protein